MKEVDIYKMIPEHIAREIMEDGASNTFTASNGSEWVQCDRCECWISADEAEVVPALGNESGYDYNGFPVQGEGTLVVCPRCAELFSTLREGTRVPPLSGEIDLGEGGLFRPAPEEEWVLVDPERGWWEIYGDHIEFPVDENEVAVLLERGYALEKDDPYDGMIARGVYLSITAEDLTAHPQKTGWIEYQID